jgi:hypothetical protein
MENPTMHMPDRKYRTRIFYTSVFLFVGLLVVVFPQVDERQFSSMAMEVEESVKASPVVRFA